jgi:hypothetical protein
MMDEFWKWFTLLFVFFLIMGIITHAYGFSQAAGTLFSGTTNLGTSLEAGNIKAGSTKA